MNSKKLSDQIASSAEWKKKKMFETNKRQQWILRLLRGMRVKKIYENQINHSPQCTQERTYVHKTLVADNPLEIDRRRHLANRGGNQAFATSHQVEYKAVLTTRVVINI